MKHDLKWAEDLARVTLINDRMPGTKNLCGAFLELLDSHGELLAETGATLARRIQMDITAVTAKARATELERELFAARVAAGIDSDEEIPLVEYIREMRAELGRK